MQTFLITPNYARTASLLDRQRLGKQRVECQQVIGVLLTRKGLPGHSGGFRHHVVCNYWVGYEPALLAYTAVMMEEWVARGYRNDRCAQTHILQVATARDAGLLDDFRYPRFDLSIYQSHRDNLVRKWEDFYRPLFEQNDLKISDDFATRSYDWSPPNEWSEVPLL